MPAHIASASAAALIRRPGASRTSHVSFIGRVAAMHRADLHETGRVPGLVPLDVLLGEVEGAAVLYRRRPGGLDDQCRICCSMLSKAK